MFFSVNQSGRLTKIQHYHSESCDTNVALRFNEIEFAASSNNDVSYL